MASMSSPPPVRALILSCHPIPSLAVTALAAGLTALAGLPPGRAALAISAVFTGQLAIGWSNDAVDAERDRVVNRADKPVASGAVTARVAGIAAVVALGATLGLAVALGWSGGLAALVVALCGGLYNIGLKATAWSWLPYAVAFGTLPAVATLSASPPRWPAAWALIAGALLGVAAHLANVLPDLGQDAATGVRGFPHRLGARTTALGGAAILTVASTVILFGTGGQPSPWRWAGFGAAALVGCTAAGTAYRDPSSRQFFFVTIVIAGMDLAFFALSGSRL